MAFPKPRGYFPGDYKVICDLTGRELLRSQCAIRWDGALVALDAIETRHPLDYERSFPEDQSIPDARPEQPDRFITEELTQADLPGPRH